MRPLKPKNSFSCFTHGFTCEFELELHTHTARSPATATRRPALCASLRLLHICLKLKGYMGVCPRPLSKSRARPLNRSEDLPRVTFAPRVPLVETACFLVPAAHSRLHGVSQSPAACLQLRRCPRRYEPLPLPQLPPGRYRC